jgi:hypothetical protein
MPLVLLLLAPLALLVLCESENNAAERSTPHWRDLEGWRPMSVLPTIPAVPKTRARLVDRLYDYSKVPTGGSWLRKATW